MKKTKRIKADLIATEGEFIAAVNAAAKGQAILLKLKAHRDLRILKLQEEAAEGIETVAALIKYHVGRAEKYADAHRKELLTGEKKSVELSTAIFGWRTGTKAVGFTAKTFTEDLVVRAFKAVGLGAYVRTAEVIAKDRIIADAKSREIEGGGEVLGLTKLVEKGGKTVEAIVALSDLGLKITQTESFFIEPKAESGETLKADAA